MESRIHALTRAPSNSLVDCELTCLERAPIDAERAARQHAAYVDLLRAWGLAVTILPAIDALPDSVFVEDTAIALPEVVIVTALGVASRKAEADLMATSLAALASQPVVRIAPPARIEGGDVLRIGRRLFVGQGPRTDGSGLRSVASIVKPFGYEVIPVRVTGCLHLKTACTALSDDTLLLNPDWVDTAPFEGFQLVPVDPGEPFAANVLRAGERLAMPAAFERTAARILERGYGVDTVDISEFQKAEAGLTCLSLLVPRAVRA